MDSPSFARVLRARRRLLSPGPDSENETTDDAMHKENSKSTIRTDLMTPSKSIDVNRTTCTPPKRKKKENQTDMTCTPVSNKKNIERLPLSPLKGTSPNTTRHSDVTDRSATSNIGGCQVLKSLNVLSGVDPVCRDQEMNVILQFYKDHVENRKPGILYITGPPGTGKSLCVAHCLHNRKVTREKFHTITLNCMNIHTPNNMLKQLIEELGVKTKAKTMHSMTEALKMHICAKGQMIVLVLDELDQMNSKHQDMMYSVFEWTSFLNSRIILIGIANALEPLNQSLPRLQRWKKYKPETLQFTPYGRDDIKQIIHDRLKSCKEDSDLLVRPEVIEYCSRSAASHNGDIRKALSILSQTVMSALNENGKVSKNPLKTSTPNSREKNESCDEKIEIRMQHMQKVVTSVGSSLSSLKGFQAQLPLQQKIIIFCLLGLLKNMTSRLKEVTMSQLQAIYNQVCHKHHMFVIDGGEFLFLCSQLEDRGIINMKKKSESLLTKISLRVDELDLEPVLKEERIIANMLDDKSLFRKK